MKKQMTQITLHHLLAKAAIQIDPSLEKMRRKKLMAQEQRQLRRMVAKERGSKRQPPMGPNSIFSFGKFLSQE